MVLRTSFPGAWFARQWGPGFPPPVVPEWVQVLCGEEGDPEGNSRWDSGNKCLISLTTTEYVQGFSRPSSEEQDRISAVGSLLSAGRAFCRALPGNPGEGAARPKGWEDLAEELGVELDLEGEGLARFFGEQGSCSLLKERRCTFFQEILYPPFLEYLQIRRCSFKKSLNSSLALKNATCSTEAAKQCKIN